MNTSPLSGWKGPFLQPAGKITDFGFTKLTTLELRRYIIMAGDPSVLNPFNGGLPCLTDLMLTDCTHYDSELALAVSVLELRNLEIRCEERKQLRISRVFAPKLESFHLMGLGRHYCCCHN
ncbi:unnamed protein product [Linum trigynum]|uniref:Uncharacterized protein n=1 Tax=Linum trigynum TaxID=586398 RepID=A0AAV2C7N2_9ROSI